MREVDKAKEREGSKRANKKMSEGKRKQAIKRVRVGDGKGVIKTMRHEKKKQANEH